MNPFKSALTRTPNFSAYDVTHHNTLTYPIGRLMPIYWEFLNPADRLVLDLSHLTRFNTLAGALMGTDLKLDVDAFAVPVRTLRHYPQDAYDDQFFNFRKNVDGAIRLPMMNHHAAYSRALQLSVNKGVPFECSLFDTLVFQFGTGIFAIQYGIAFFQYHFLVFRTIANGDDFTLKGFLLSCVGNDDTSNCLCFCRGGLYEYAVCQWFNAHNFCF